MRHFVMNMTFCGSIILTASAGLADGYNPPPNAGPTEQTVNSGPTPQKKSWPASFKRQRPDATKSAGHRQRWKRTRSDDYDTATKATDQTAD